VAQDDNAIELAARAPESMADPLGVLEVEATAELERLITWWTTHAPRPDFGFWGAIDEAGVADGDTEPSIILNTRLLWFFSSAFAATQDEACKIQARRAYDVIMQKFYDPATETFVWSLTPEGAPSNRRKQTYAQAFAIYALAAYAQATGSMAALDLALKVFDQVQRHFSEGRFGGWIEALGPDLEPILDVRLSEKDLNAPKSMNTHLHVLEAFSGLYSTAQKLGVGAQRLLIIELALRDAVSVMTTHIVHPKGDTLGLFFDLDWTLRSGVRSFGHDIEASWLIYEAACALGDPGAIAQAKVTALALAYGALEGISSFGGLHEEMDANGHIRPLHVWWIQAEALVGFLNAYHLSGDEAFRTAALRVWEFIKAHQIDRDGGEWRELSCLDDQTTASGLMVGPWKCPYHTGRAMLETIKLTQTMVAGQ
jgi:mannobiose 2-epimerase